MPQLIRNIQGIVHENVNGSLILNKPLIGEIQKEDYIYLNGMVAYLQNLSRTEFTQALLKPLNFGLVNQNNLPMVTLEISY